MAACWMIIETAVTSRLSKSGAFSFGLFLRSKCRFYKSLYRLQRRLMDDLLTPRKAAILF